MATKQEAIDKILAELDGVDGSWGGALLSKDGMIIASRFDKRYADDKVAALVSSAIATTNKIIKEAVFGVLDTLLIEGTDGKLAIISSKTGRVFIALIGTRDLNIGLARISLEDAMEDLEDIITA